MAIYAYPDVGRSGLGNMLFPWARAEVFAAKHGLRILAPRWTQPKIGPLLRREKDLRYYMGLFSSRGYVRGVKRAVVLARGRRITGEDAEAFMGSRASGAGTSVVVFSGWKGWFDGLLPHREFIAERLGQMLSMRVRRRLAAAGDGYEIGVHVRRGDKVPLPFGQPMSGSSGETLDSQWYVNAIRSVRAEIGKEARVRVFSDAKPGQIDSILAEPGVTRSADNPSIVDILLLSRARVLIGTGGSSFSAWASYLGAHPTLWYPGSGLVLVEGRPELSIETDLTGQLPSHGCEVLRGAT